jgi:hypothetical protein
MAVNQGSHAKRWLPNIFIILLLYLILQELLCRNSQDDSFCQVLVGAGHNIRTYPGRNDGIN